MKTIINENLDVIIIGGGPAGISAAIWCNDLGLKSVLFEESGEMGGQLLWTYNEVSNYPGVFAQDGKQLRDAFLSHAGPRNLSLMAGSKVSKVDLIKKEVVLASSETYVGKAIVIATGIRRRKLGVEGEDTFVGRGILRSGKKDLALVVGKNVCIVGGGDAAVENALILAQKAASVTLIHRSERFSARPEFIEKVKADEKIRIFQNSMIERIAGQEALNSIKLCDLKTGEKSDLAADYLLIRIGVEPNTELFSGQLDLDKKGYITVDSSCQTSLKKIFAVGDAANPVSPTVATAVGMGATAAKAVYECLKN